MGRSPAETMFARKVKSVFDKLIPRQAKFKKTVSPHKKHFYPGDKVLFKAYKSHMSFWEVGTIKQRIGELVYIVQGQKTPTNTIWTSSGNAVWMNLRNHHKIPAKSRSTQYSIISISTRLKSLRKYDAREEKKIYATTRRKSQEAEVLIVMIFLPFFQEKKKTLGSGGGLRPKLTGIMDSSSTMLIAL